jgi:SAM-dependent methyltransferase
MEIKECRSCNSEKLKEIISLGEHYISDFIRYEKDQDNIPRVPLNLILCEGCKLLQLRHNAPAELMWGDQYGYKSGINRLIRDDLKDIVEKSESLVKLDNGDIVVDIGCNDGTMLSYYKNKNLNLVGFEPSGNVFREAKEKGYNIINNFFNVEDYKREFGNKKAKILTAISMFYDLEDPNKFLEDIKSCLDEDGLFIIQQNYVVSMLEQNAFDNICHEHREFYSLNSLEHLLNRHSLEVFDVELNNINGGSLRTYVKYKNNKMKGFEGVEQRILNIRKKEEALQLDTPKPYQEFASRIDSIKKQIMDFLRQEKSKGKTIGLCGASTRGNTTLQYFGITPDLVVAASEANPDKWGKKTVGTLIPIVSIDEMKKINPDYQLVLIWHLFEGLRNKEKDFIKNGGKFILPLPGFKVVGD